MSGTGQRFLLALLLCHHSRIISVNRLVDLLWPDTPPRNGLNSLQLKISRLRQVLGDRSRIRYEPGGYRLVIAPGELDAQLFEGLATDGRSALAAGDAEKAAELLTNALDLWRGSAFAGVDDMPVVREEAARLEEERLAVLESRLEADLMAGRHSELVGELTQLCSRYPLREKFRGQLMLALYRSGRQADALQVYREAREQLADELGIDPGPELRKLEQAILLDDPTLAPVPPEAGPPVRPVLRPAQLPRDIGTFTGRADEVGRLNSLLRKAEPVSMTVCVIDGAAGIGKSALAIHVAHAAASAYPDGQIYLNLHGATPGLVPLTSHEALLRLFRALDVKPSQPAFAGDAEEAAAYFRTVTAGRRLLVVLDDAASEAQVRPLLPGGAGCAVLITSRRVLSALDGATHLHLDTLGQDDAEALLAQLAGAQRVSAEAGASAEIVRLCGRLPLAIRVAGARISARPDRTLGGFAERLAGAHRRLDELEHADLAVRASFLLSLRQLTVEAIRIFRLLGLLAVAQIGSPAIAALTGLRSDRVEPALDSLVDAQLVLGCGGRYAMHDLVRLYSKEHAETHISAGDRAAAVRRALHHYLATTRNAMQALVSESAPRLSFGLPGAQLVVPGLALSDRRAATAWFDAEADNLISVARQAAGSPGDGPSVAFGLITALVPLFGLRGRRTELLPLNLLAGRIADDLDDTRAQALAHTDIGGAYRACRQLDRAVGYFERALPEWRSIGDAGGEIDALNGLAVIARSRGHFDEATAYYRRAIELRRDLDDRLGVAHLLNSIGFVLHAQRRFEPANDHYQQALSIFRDLGDLVGQGMVLGNLAELQRVSGHPDQALAAFSEALFVIREAGDRTAEAEALWNLGYALHTLGQPDQARDRWEQAVLLLLEMRALTAAEAQALLSDPVPEMPAPLRLPT
jgi:DNA-binding SARP family transcriptional activator/Tfp pilus assembly protein PilF